MRLDSMDSIGIVVTVRTGHLSAQVICPIIGQMTLCSLTVISLHLIVRCKVKKKSSRITCFIVRLGNPKTGNCWEEGERPVRALPAVPQTGHKTVAGLWSVSGQILQGGELDRHL